ncbi:hypothetical protein TIFTF001_037974 [Ficus carica]|uniref:Uncharacterized protein n=1 Tax=Ficus carica TaxID=3494 RepID=A0AA88E801_FICCA|nr:hypothetical protein TIFTF001_037974 [Ficus carica]
MSEEEETTVGVNSTSKPTALKVEPDDMTRHLMTCDSTPCAAILAYIPRQ